jgi:AraC family transcriptional regulator of arabinose operon
MPEILKSISKINIRRSGGGVTFGDVDYLPGGQFGPRIQQDYQLVALLEGEMAVEINGAVHEVPPGHVILCEPGGRERFSFARLSASRHQWCAVDPGVIPPDLAGRLEQSGRVLPLSEALRQLHALGLARPAEEPDAQAPLLRALGLAALETFLADASAAGRPKPGSSAYLRALDLLHNRFAEEWTLAGLAARSGVSPNHLIKLFRAHAGATPMEFLWRLRLAHGAALLRETGLGVGEIAYRCGFQNPFHFSRRFKHCYGHSPQAHRRTVHGGMA